LADTEHTIEMLGSVAYGVSEYLHERWYGIRTAGLVMPDDLGDAGHAYFPISYLDLKRIMRRVEVRPGDVFIDFGSGMGRVPIFAATLPFSRVIGVELSGELNAIALQNLERARGRLLCQDVSFVECDARDYEIPADASVIYFFMPFGLDILREVVANILESQRREPRRVDILYGYPVTGAVKLLDLDSTPGLRIVDDEPLSSNIRLTRAVIGG
jgi:SAM-dependent methyltransferase